MRRVGFLSAASDPALDEVTAAMVQRGMMSLGVDSEEAWRYLSESARTTGITHEHLTATSAHHVLIVRTHDENKALLSVTAFVSASLMQPAAPQSRCSTLTAPETSVAPSPIVLQIAGRKQRCWSATTGV